VRARGKAPAGRKAAQDVSKSPEWTLSVGLAGVPHASV